MRSMPMVPFNSTRGAIQCHGQGHGTGYCIKVKVKETSTDDLSVRTDWIVGR